MFLRANSCPLMRTLKNVAMRQINSILQSHLAKMCILQFSFFISSDETLWCTNSNAPHHYPSCNTQSCPRKYATPHLSTSCKALHTQLEEFNLIPPKSNRDSFVKNEKTATIVLHIHLEVFVSPSAFPFNSTCASKTMLFYKSLHVRH